jgi:hypothetical protein
MKGGRNPERRTLKMEYALALCLLGAFGLALFLTAKAGR